MQDTTLLHYLSKKLHTYVYKYSLEEELLYSNCDVVSLQDSYMEDAGFFSFLLSEKNAPLLHLKSLKKEFIFCQVVGHDGIYILGPVRFPSQVFLQKNYDEFSPEEDFKTIVPLADIVTYWDDIAFLYEMIIGEKIIISKILADNFVNESGDEKIQEEYNNLLFANQENEIHHNPYDQELREFNSIETGDLQKLKASWQEDYDGTLGTLAKEPLRNMKNLVIVIITLASRAAIRGGLSAELSFSLSDTYIQEIEACNDIALLRTLGHNAEEQYTRLVYQVKSQQKGSAKKEKNPRINRCKDYIFSHLHDRITVEDLAREADCNPNYLSGLFKKCEGVSISTFILQEKINRAKNLLIYSDYSFIEIASYLGFSSQSHLGKQFKRFTGYTLRQYRENNGRWN